MNKEKPRSKYENLIIKKKYKSGEPGRNSIIKNGAIHWIVPFGLTRICYANKELMSQTAKARKTSAIPILTAAACFFRKAVNCLDVVP